MTKDEYQKLLDAENERNRERDRDRAEVERLGEKIDELNRIRINAETALQSARTAYTRADREYMDKWDGRKR